MIRRIKSVLNQGGNLVAILDCAHRYSSATLSELDAAESIEVECHLCDELSLPDGLIAYKKTPEFNQETIPAGFKRAHSTKAGTWAKIMVTDGSLRYVVDYLQHKTFYLKVGTIGVISPEMEHHVDSDGGSVSFYVEFFKADN